MVAYGKCKGGLTPTGEVCTCCSSCVFTFSFPGRISQKVYSFFQHIQREGIACIAYTHLRINVRRGTYMVVYIKEHVVVDIWKHNDNVNVTEADIIN